MRQSIMLGAIMLIAASLFFAGCAKPSGPGVVQLPPSQQQKQASDVKSFSSWQEVSSFLQSASSGQYGGYNRGGMFDAMAAVSLGEVKATSAVAQESLGSAPSPSATDYSQTNVQVEGVDEADIVKNDGKYIYMVVPGERYDLGKVVIIEAYPAESMKKVAEFSINGSAEQIFIYNDKLVVFGSSYRERHYAMPVESKVACMGCIVPPYYRENFAFLQVYDVSDRAAPKLEKEIEAKGSYLQSRMIGGKVYAVFQDHPDYRYPVPVYYVDGVQRDIGPSEVSYFDWPDDAYNYNVFIGLDLGDLSKEASRKAYLMGYSQNLFVSQDNMYVTYTSFDRYFPMWKAYEETYGMFFDQKTRERIADVDSMDASDWLKDRMKSSIAAEFSNNDSNYDSAGYMGDMARTVLQAQLAFKTEEIRVKEKQSSEKTVINKIALDSNFTYLARGEVPGHVLNQFSMDESNGHFRIATTQGRLSRSGSKTSSGVYVLDSDLKETGRIEGIAPGESIYSARFLGSRAYLVTFKKVDPFFVLDLSDPASPKLLGKLKIPGYSDYLHPYDENYVIGLGKGSVAAEEGDFAWYQGVKLSLFDVRDVANPREAAKFEIGDRGTDSYALSDHKAFLFSKEKNLLVIPVLLAELDKSKYAGTPEPYAYGDYTFQGAYVFSLSPEEGFALRGRISHADEQELLKSGEYFWSGASVKRSLYMDNSLYTVSDMFVKANDLGNLSAISSVQVSEGPNYGYGYYE